MHQGKTYNGTQETDSFLSKYCIWNVRWRIEKLYQKINIITPSSNICCQQTK